MNFESEMMISNGIKVDFFSRMICTSFEFSIVCSETRRIATPSPQFNKVELTYQHELVIQPPLFEKD